MGFISSPFVHLLNSVQPVSQSRGVLFAPFPGAFLVAANRTFSSVNSKKCLSECLNHSEFFFFL